MLLYLQSGYRKWPTHQLIRCYNFIHQTSVRSLTQSPTQSVLQFTKQVHVHSHIHQLTVTILFTKQMHVHSHIHQLHSVLQFYSPNKCMFTHTFTLSLSHTQPLAYSLTHLLIYSHSIHSLAPSWPSAQCPCNNNFLVSLHQSLGTGTGTSIIALPFSLSTARATNSSSSVSRDEHGNVHNSSALQPQLRPCNNFFLVSF